MSILESVEKRRAALAARVPVWQPTTMDRAFSLLAHEFADRPFVMSAVGTLTYGDVAAEAETYAKGLRTLGIKPGDKVALLMANHPVFVPLAYAVWRLGASLIPLNFAFREKELDYVLRQSRAAALITMADFRDLDYLAMLDQLAPGWEEDPKGVYPDLKAIVLHGENDRDALDTAKLCALGAADDSLLPENPAQPDDLAVMMYTSGTTGLPKGVLQTHDNVLRISYALAYHQAYREGRRTLFSLPLYHAFGLVIGVIASIWCGGAIIPQLVFDPAQTLSDIEELQATDALFVPTMVMAILANPNREKYDLSSLTSVLSGSAPTPVHVWKEMIAFMELEEVFTGYGMTELSCATVLTASGDPLDLLEKTVGRTIDAGAAGLPADEGLIGRYMTCDPFTGDLLPEGNEGELVFMGPTATQGYFERPEENENLFTKGGWLRSGDLGRVRPDGYIELTGRSKELYKTGAELVAPKEVEEVLNEHEAVAQCYVIGVPDDKWGEIGAAWVVPEAGSAPTEQQLQSWCAERLAKYKWPRHIFFAAGDTLPTTPTGKVQKFELVKRAQEILKSSGAS